MTLLQIYDQIIGNVYGEATPTAGVKSRLKGSTGVIAQAMKTIQGNHPWWFMVQEDTISIVAGTVEYDLPARFKNYIALRYLKSDGNYTEKLIDMDSGGEYVNVFDPDAETDYPPYFEIRGDKIRLSAKPAVNSTLYVLFYQYFEDPSDVEATWDATSNDLTDNASDVIITTVTVRLTSMLHDFQSVGFWISQANYYLAELKKVDFQRKKRTPFVVEYSDI